MTGIEWNEGLNQLDSDLIEDYIEQKDRLERRKRRRVVRIRLGSMAASLCLILSTFFLLPLLEEDPQITPTTQEPTPTIHIGNTQPLQAGPLYYGNASSESVGAAAELNNSGISVTATFSEGLPDTYTFYDDWRQDEYRILRMKTVTLLKGQEMTEEFYYLVPVDYMTDFSLYDRFVILDMSQYTYECAVLYNKSQNKAEKMDLVIFGYDVYANAFLGSKIMAFDVNGNFDARLWDATEKWRSSTAYGENTIGTILEAEEKARQDTWCNDLCVHRLMGISGEAAEVLEQITTLENGIYVPRFSTQKLYLYPEVQLTATRYLNGFATNESVSIYSKEWTGGEEDTYSRTKAQFSEADQNALPNLAGALEAVSEAYNAGRISPPHIQNSEELKLYTYGIFGWYAKTDNGVVGIVRITWRYWSNELDDAYYIIEYGEDGCVPISRDDLLIRLGGYESTFIFLGDYDENGKIGPLIPLC